MNRTTTQRHEALTVSIRQLSESMGVARDRCLAAAGRGDHRAAAEAGAKYFRLATRRDRLEEQLDRLDLVLSN